ncbi:MAG: segregation ATPase FtsK/SpoIIIE, family [Ilumatobacteraceae bacterium]|nr:segregation ATPase FtsK/SpoIIIE, family [Ilumatobacteraceae bacterium]
MGAVLDAGALGSSDRPEPTTWSTIEYACHARDVLFNLRDRIINGLAEDNPTPKPMFNDVRMAAGLYAREEPQRLALEVVVAAGMLARTVELLDPVQLSRTLVYPWPRSADRSLLWVAAQALHELEHHLDDVRRSVA